MIMATAGGERGPFFGQNGYSPCQKQLRSQNPLPINQCTLIDRQHNIYENTILTNTGKIKKLK
jgi:hypothetical protein